MYSLLRRNTMIQNPEAKDIFKSVTTFSTGKSFGEKALIDKINKRSATVRCITDCEFAVMNKTDYRSILANIERKRREKFVEFFKHMPIFKSWTPRELHNVIYKLETQEYIYKQSVFEQNKYDPHIFI